DRDYAHLEWVDPLFAHALYLHSTVISSPSAQRVVLDAGLKSTTAESGLPAIRGEESLQCVALHDEHCIVAVGEGCRRPVLGEKLLLIPAHCDPTFNLHDEVVAVRNGKVEAIWPVAARGFSR